MHYRQARRMRSSSTSLRSLVMVYRSQHMSTCGLRYQSTLMAVKEGSEMHVGALDTLGMSDRFDHRPRRL
jgi:hypothetical protein